MPDTWRGAVCAGCFCGVRCSDAGGCYIMARSVADNMAWHLANNAAIKAREDAEIAAREPKRLIPHG